jgi:putative nucleotidyltransferase with HDIG domain
MAPAADDTRFSFASVDSTPATSELIAAIQRLALARSLDDIAAIVRQAARRLSSADGATLVLREGRQCFYADEDAIAPLWKGQRFPMDACVSGWVMSHREPAIIADVSADPRVPIDAYRPTFVKSLCLVPIRTLDPIGAIGNYWATVHQPTPGEVQMLQALADSTAVAIENVRIVEELEEARLEVLQRLAVAAEYRDDSTFEHTERVARVTALLAERSGLPSGSVDLLRQAAPLHDIGKIAVPDAVLLKRGPLTAGERLQMQHHVPAGAAILEGSRSRVLQTAREIVLGHHEWWNGGGYPFGLSGETIPLSSRLVAIADVFDALTHDRPYKQAWPLDAALAEIDRLSGVQFDPALVALFRSLDARSLL